MGIDSGVALCLPAFTLSGMNADDRQLLEDVKLLFASQPLAALATHNQGQPYGSLVAFAATPDLHVLLFATNRATRKFANLCADGRVSLLVDNRQNAERDFRDAMAVTALGTATEVAAAERTGMLQLYLARHPQLAAFVQAPACALLAVRITQYIVVRQFQDVRELRFP